MSIYYKSVRIINGKPKRVIVDEYGDIIIGLTKEQINSAIEDPKRYKQKEKECCICGNNTTYMKGLDQFGNPVYGWRNCVCGKKNCTKFLCNACGSNICQNLSDSQNNKRKYIADSRTGNIDRFTNHGKDLIGQWMGAQVLGLKDLNLENNNFREYVDLSPHIIRGNVDVKIRTYNPISCQWNISPIKRDCRTTYEFDNILAICMDKYEHWKHVEKVHMIPKNAVEGITGFAIVKPTSLRGCKWDQFLIDRTHYEELYNSVDIPRFFNPWNLWQGKYKR